MNRIVSMIFAASAIALTAGCAGESSVAFEAGGPYDGYYDDYYGPFYSGYWGGDGFFYYNDGGGDRHRDDGNHFRHDGGDGCHGVPTGSAGGARIGGGGFRHLAGGCGDPIRGGGRHRRGPGNGRWGDHTRAEKMLANQNPRGDILEMPAKRRTICRNGPKNLPIKKLLPPCR